MNTLEIVFISLSSILAGVNVWLYRKYRINVKIKDTEIGNVKFELANCANNAESNKKIEIQKIEIRLKTEIDAANELATKLQLEINVSNTRLKNLAQEFLDLENNHRKNLLEIEYQHKVDLQQIHDIENQHRKEILELEHKHKMEMENCRTFIKKSESEIELIRNGAYENGFKIGGNRVREDYAIVIEPFAKQNGYVFKSATTGYTATLYLRNMATGFTYEKVLNEKQSLDKETIEVVANNLVNVIKASAALVGAANGILMPKIIFNAPIIRS